VKQDELERIVAAFPGFRDTWDKFLLDSNAKASPLWYIGMAELAHYVVESYSKGRTSEFPDFFASVESVLQNADPELETLITIGLFEDIQNIGSHRECGSAVFRQWLGPRSLVIWDKIDAYMQRVAEWTQQQKRPWWQFWRRKSFDYKTALSQVENPELRKIIESSYRKVRKRP